MLAAVIKLACAFLLCLSSNESPAGYVGASTVAQAQQHMNASSNLPALSERATGLNSRYLSAGSTASLAAATVAAANQAPQQQQSQQPQQQQVSSSNGNNLAQQQHQHQHQQQQQPVVAGNSAQAGAQHVSPGQALASPQVQLPGAAQQYSTAPLANGLASFPVPVMTSTYAFNPLTGQYGPAELPGPPIPLLGASNQGFSQPNLIQQLLAQQQQQQQFGSSYNNFARSPQRFNGLPSQQPYYQALGGGQNSAYSGSLFARQPQQSTAFSRRVGALQPGAGGSRNNNGLLSVDDDSNGLFQQQQVSSGSLADQLAATLGLNLDPSYGLTGYQQQQQSQAHQQIDSQQQQQQNNYANQQSSLAPQAVFPVAAAAQQSSELPRSDQCVAADGRHGTCYQASECIRRGGTPMGRCGASSGGQQSGGVNFAAELSGSSHVCCLFDVTCGQFAAERFVYFRNPNYPNTFDQTRMCRAKIGKLDKGVCQFRLDLLHFDIAKPTNGNCSHDMFVVSGQNENYIIPKICGFNDGQHYYVGVDESGVITLHMMMMGFYRRSFEVLITQIPCRSDFAAPAHCLQYFMGTHGTIKSFNYDDEVYGAGQSQSSFVNYDLQPDGSSGNGLLPTAPYGLQFNGGGSGQLQQRQGNGASPFGPTAAALQSNRYQQLEAYQFGGYPNDLDYTICIRKESGFCSITYQLSRGEQGLSPFAVGQSSLWANDTQGGPHYGGGSTLSTSSVSTECRDDYLLIGGVRLCSGQAQGAGAFFDQQFGAQGSNSSAAGGYSVQQQQQLLLNQQNMLMQQLARLQQQPQQSNAASGNVQSVGVNTNSNNPNQQSNAGTGNGGANVDQQQAALVQQLMITQQQLNNLAANNNGNFGGANNRFQQADGQFSDLQGAIITDTTSGPFLLRFVSNMARNARGFHIDYRQNPCK